MLIKILFILILIGIYLYLRYIPFYIMDKICKIYDFPEEHTFDNWLIGTYISIAGFYILLVTIELLYHAFICIF